MFISHSCEVSCTPWGLSWAVPPRRRLQTNQPASCGCAIQAMRLPRPQQGKRKLEGASQALT